MQDYHIVPQAPLMFRDSRPFDAGGVAETLPFPMPSTLAGAFRTAYGEQHEVDYRKNGHELLSIPVAGPLLTATSLDESDQNQHSILFPAPANAVCLGNQDKATIYRLKPIEIAVGEGTDLHTFEGGLQPLFLNSNSQEKPYKDAPAFWRSEQMEKWLLGDSDTLDASSIGINAIPTELRTHVKMQNSVQTAEPGRLFQTLGLDMGEKRLKEKNSEFNYGWNKERYGFAIRSSESIEQTYRTVGGESRLAYIQPVKNLWPVCSPGLQKALNSANSITLTLVTPAIFENGWLPGWLKREEFFRGVLPGTNLKLKLRAVANARWQAISGWAMQADKETPGRIGAKPIRRAVPAGAVYWFDIEGGDRGELSKLWLQSISDYQSNDGFGLVLPGIWNKE